MKRADTVGIVGAGAFGTALGSVLARAGRRVVLWSRDAGVVDSIQTQRRCPRLPEAPLPEPLEATTDPRKLANEARFLVMAVSSADVRDRARELGAYLDGSHIVVHAIGALAAPNNVRVSEVMAEGLPTLKIGVLAGPALPHDLAAGEYSSVVVASTFDEVCAEARRLLNAPPALRLYSSHDLAGVELASALSTAYTVALGLCDGLNMGPGPRAVLITRAVAEASRLGTAAGAEARTFAGLAGLGNLLVRATDRSPDYQLGRRIADGVVSADGERTEGARAALAGAALAKQLRVRMPVLTGVAAVLAGKAELREAAHLIGDSVAVEE
ncbi:MAG: NAD(P)H-dependent glycerol-3-phosphate dehydrogenase [Kofleriaceae bacterium]|nr:NAD(P)H-dependent glycerol-3-phosphate dehydrogenase [Kofleriaceae bacterium]